jgi:hypothetical protein
MLVPIKKPAMADIVPIPQRPNMSILRILLVASRRTYLPGSPDTFAISGRMAATNLPKLDLISFAETCRIEAHAAILGIRFC